MRVLQGSNEKSGIQQVLMTTPPIFTCFLRGLFIVLLALMSVQSFAKEISYADQCNQEAAQESINKPRLKDVCLKAAKQAEIEKKYGNASWYYLLAGELDYLLKEMPKHINPKKSTVIYAHLGHAYVLKDQSKKALEMYWKFHTLGGQVLTNQLTAKEYSALKEENSDLVNESIGNIKTFLQIIIAYQSMQDQYLILNKLYTHEKDNKNGLKYWEKTKKDFIEMLQQGADFNSKSISYYEAGRYKKALYWQYQSLDIRRKILGEKHPDTASNYNNIGEVYNSMGDYTKALEFHNKALIFWEKALGKDHFNTATSYNNIGMVYHSIGVYPKAFELFNKALVIQERVLGKVHPSTAKSLNNIGLTYHSMGEFHKALKFYNQALIIREMVLDKEDPDIAISYDNIGLTYQSMGNYSKALVYQTKALVILKKVKNSEHPDIAIAYNNISLTHRSMGNYPKALEFQTKALVIFNKILGEMHASTASAYSNIGLIHELIGEYSKALNFYNKALMIQENVIGKEHPSVAITYHNIGSSYDSMSKYSKALEFYNKALVIQEAALGKQHSNTALSYNNIGTTYGALGNHSKAYQYSKKAFTTFLLNRNNNFSALNTQQKRQFLKANEHYIDFLLRHSSHYLNLLTKQNKTQETSTLRQTTTNDWLAFKGSVLDSENRLLHLAQTSKDPVVKEKYSALVAAKKFYGQLNQTIPDTKEKIAKWKERLKAQEEKIAQLEREIIATDPRFKDEKALQAINSNDIATRLNKDALYIDFAKTNDGYYLFTIDHQNQLSFTAYSAEDSKAIDKNIIVFQEMMTLIDANKSLINQPKDKTKQLLGTLYQLIFTKDLLAKIANKKELIISPDGALRLLPFEALIDSKPNKYLIESKNIRYIASGKEFVRLNRQNKDSSNSETKAVLFANPDFGGKPSKASSESRGTIYTVNTDETRTRNTLVPHFASLPGTKTEADAITRVLSPSNIRHNYRGKDANEAYLMEVEHPRILHIATHGFFLKDIPNPMLKSGLILAGANTSLENNKGDGIVTALDLSGLNLKGTDLVVLSACETGKVDPNNTDGISGLTKAFIQAGAKDVVMSLWSVDDKETAPFMKNFYAESLKNDRQYSQALKKSKLEMLYGGKSEHPYYWAAFVLSGL